MGLELLLSLILLVHARNYVYPYHSGLTLNYLPVGWSGNCKAENLILAIVEFFYLFI